MYFYFCHTWHILNSGLLTKKAAHLHCRYFEIFKEKIYLQISWYIKCLLIMNAINCKETNYFVFTAINRLNAQIMALMTFFCTSELGSSFVFSWRDPILYCTVLMSLCSVWYVVLYVVFIKGFNVFLTPGCKQIFPLWENKNLTWHDLTKIQWVNSDLKARAEYIAKRKESFELC